MILAAFSRCPDSPKFTQIHYSRSFGFVVLFVTLATTKCRDLSYNKLSGPVPTYGSFSLFTPIRYYNPFYYFLSNHLQSLTAV